MKAVSAPGNGQLEGEGAGDRPAGARQSEGPRGLSFARCVPAPCPKFPEYLNIPQLSRTSEEEETLFPIRIYYLQKTRLVFQRALLFILLSF